MTPTQVHVIVTGRHMGKALIVPYNHTMGLQMYVVNGIRTGDLVVYEVPYYEVVVEGGSHYSAVRFGLKTKENYNRRAIAHATPVFPITNYVPRLGSRTTALTASKAPLAPVRGVFCREEDS